MIVKIYELRNQTNEELNERLRRLNKELSQLRLTASVSKVENPHQFELKRRERAKILTLLRERELKKDVTSTTKAT